MPDSSSQIPSDEFDDEQHDLRRDYHGHQACHDQNSTTFHLASLPFGTAVVAPTQRSAGRGLKSVPVRTLCAFAFAGTRSPAMRSAFSAVPLYESATGEMVTVKSAVSRRTAPLYCTIASIPRNGTRRLVDTAGND